MLSTAFSEQFPTAVWNAVSWAIILILPQIKVNSQLWHCAFFQLTTHSLNFKSKKIPVSSTLTLQNSYDIYSFSCFMSLPLAYKVWHDWPPSILPTSFPASFPITHHTSAAKPSSLFLYDHPFPRLLCETVPLPRVFFPRDLHKAGCLFWSEFRYHHHRKAFRSQRIPPAITDYIQLF